MNPLDSIVKDIRSQCESDGCVIILIDQENRKIDLISYDHSHDRAFAPVEEDVFFRPEFYDTVERWRDIMGQSNCFIISNENELKEVENFRMRQKLEKFSRTDMLTGVLDRNAMNKRVKELESDNSGHGLGAVFVDVNGLKVVNDTKGHSAGDEMIRSVAYKLKNIYPDEEIYRAGGDEFLIIVTDMDRERFTSRFDSLRSVARIKGEASFAVGAHYEDSEKDISRVMSIADENMYHDKADCYEQNPELKRRVGE